MRSDYLPPDCWRELYRVMTADNVNAMRVSLETGLRIDDVLSLRPQDVKKKSGGYSIEYTAKKTNKSGKAGISADLARELLSRAGTAWLFEGRQKDKHRTRQAVYKDVKKAARLLGAVGQISPHSARKTFAVELRKRSGVAEVQKALQHSNADVTHLYAFADMASKGGAIASQRAFAEMVADVVIERLKEKSCL